MTSPNIEDADSIDSYSEVYNSSLGCYISSARWFWWICAVDCSIMLTDGEVLYLLCLLCVYFFIHSKLSYLLCLLACFRFLNPHLMMQLSPFCLICQYGFEIFKYGNLLFYESPEFYFIILVLNINMALIWHFFPAVCNWKFSSILFVFSFSMKQTGFIYSKIYLLLKQLIAEDDKCHIISYF